jgi:hypothetical protein
MTVKFPLSTSVRSTFSRTTSSPRSTSHPTVTTRTETSTKLNPSIYIYDMREGTLSTYPHLIEMQPINGTVFWASQLIRPRPKIVPMTSKQVQKHQKKEGIRALNRLMTVKRGVRDVVQHETSSMNTMSSQSLPCETTVAGVRKSNVFKRLGTKVKKLFHCGFKTKSSYATPTNNNLQDPPPSHSISTAISTTV